MLNCLMIWSGFNALLSLVLFKEKRLKKGVCWTSFLVATGIFLLCFSRSFILQMVMAFCGVAGLAALCFNFGLVFLLSGIYIVFIHMIRAESFQSASYLIIIGICLFNIYFQLMLAF